MLVIQHGTDDFVLEISEDGTDWRLMYRGSLENKLDNYGAVPKTLTFPEDCEVRIGATAVSLM